MVYPEPRRRPTVVTISTVLLLVYAAAALLSSALTLTTLGATSDAVRNVYSGTAVGPEALDTAVSLVVGFVVAIVVVNVVLALSLIVLSLFNNRGSVPSRIVTWVVAGIAVCCGGYGLLGTAGSGTFDVSDSGPSAAEMEAQVAAAYPDWYTPALTTLSVISLLAVLAAIILLALPAASDYFQRRPRPRWDPQQA